MENIQVETKRDNVPAWAREPKTMADKITPPQRKFLLSLIDERDAGSDPSGKMELMIKALRISEDPEEFGMSKKQASVLIEWFLKRPKKPRDVTPTVTDGIETTTDLSGLPPGRYAIEQALGQGEELRFYQCWQSRDKQAKRLYVMFGPYENKLPIATQEAIAKAIIERGVRQCAIRFGMEIGECSNCGRRLTNHISRALGIGPVCGGRMFGDDGWKDEVKSKRQELKDAGIDPDENVA